MAASSSSSQIKRNHVFPSFHGPDVRKGFLSHLHYHFDSKGITTFKDQEIERGQSIGPELVQAIRESRVSIVVLSKKYASSSWCLDELVEILKCKEEAQGQIVMTIFYEVDPSDVRKQLGDFGKAFDKTCEGKTEEVKQRWSKALAHVATIAGEHSLKWASEAEMIQKIATDVSKKLNVTPSRDFEGMVGLQAHLTKLNSLLCLESDQVKMIGIWGPAGIGKTTIARALHNQLSSSFQLECFMGNLKESGRIIGVDDYDSKLALQNQLLSMVLNQKNMKIRHLTGPCGLVVKEPQLRRPPPEFKPRPLGYLTWSSSSPGGGLVLRPRKPMGYPEFLKIQKKEDTSFRSNKRMATRPASTYHS